MGILDIITLKPFNKLSPDEVKVAKILHNIFVSFKMNDTDCVHDLIESISTHLYNLSVRRAYKKAAQLDESLAFNGPRAFKYFAIYQFIEDAVMEMCRDPLFISEPVSFNDFAENLNYLLQASANKIREI